MGFTVNPARRVQQHNGGRKKAGPGGPADAGPGRWCLSCTASLLPWPPLRFEWAWQHPRASRRLAHVGPRLRSEAAFAFHLRVLAHMLRAPPWARLPLTVRWLRADFRRELCPPPPPHMPLAFGPPPPRARERRAGPSADPEPERDRDADASCALCARSFQDEEGPLCCPTLAAA